LVRFGPPRSNVHHDLAPAALAEPGDAERGASDVADDNGQPDIVGLQRSENLDGEAHAHRQQHLGNEGDIEGALRVAGPLKPASVGEGGCDEEAGNAEVAQELDAQVDHFGVSHAKDGQELPGRQEKE
jgi:hypothetical protein